MEISNAGKDKSGFYYGNARVRFIELPPSLTPITPPNKPGGSAEPSINQSITYSGWFSLGESGHGFWGRRHWFFRSFLSHLTQT